MTVEKREEIVDKFGYCSNCLASSHDLRACISMETCRKCGMFHHTLLHPRRARTKNIRTKELRQRKRQRHHRNQRHRSPQLQPASKSKSAKPTTSSCPSFESSSTSKAAQSQKVIIDAICSLATILSGTNKE